MKRRAGAVTGMTSRWRWLVSILFRRIWFRAALFSVLSVLLALLAAFVAPYIPYEISTKIGSDAVDNILGIMASSMLAVTTFSLGAMVSAVAGATSTLTPRATQLLVEDSTAQNALSTFIGAFLFAIVGICALSTGIYGKSGRVILLVGTILVIAIIVITLLKWINHLATFGRVGETIDRVEKVTRGAIDRLGFTVSIAPPTPSDTMGRHAVFASRIGYVTHIDTDALEGVADHLTCAIDVQVTPGQFVTRDTAIVWLDRSDAQCDDTIREAFTFGHHRQFDHDPQMGLVVLSEIASRALSPAVNDPGTAISVLGAGVRVMTAMLDEDRPQASEDSQVRLPAMDATDLIHDLFRPIARDGAGVVEVAIKLQRSLHEIAVAAPRAYGLLAMCAADALARNEAAMAFPADVDTARAAYRRYWVEPKAGR